MYCINSTLTLSFVCSYSEDGEDCGDETEIAEMPFDLDIEVEALALDDHEIDRLRAETA